MQSVATRTGAVSSSKKLASILRRPSQKENIPVLDIIAQQPNQPHHHRSSHDIPVKYQGTLYWVTGLTRQSTCYDVITALLKKVHGNSQSVQCEAVLHSLWERWREVERPLKNKTRVLKVWRAWGTECHDVCFYLRKLDSNPEESATYARPRRKERAQDLALSPSSRGSRHYRHGDHQRKSDKRRDDGPYGTKIKRAQSLDKLYRSKSDVASDCRPTNHPLLSSQWKSTHCLQSNEIADFCQPLSSCQSSNIAHNPELPRHITKLPSPPPPPLPPRYHYPQQPYAHLAPTRPEHATIPIPARTYYDLVQTILKQERQIQEQMQRLRDTDQEIVSYENQVHVTRMRENGQDYVQKAYLSSPAKTHEADHVVSPEGKQQSTVSKAGSEESTCLPDCNDIECQALPAYCMQSDLVRSTYKSRFGGKLMPPIDDLSPLPTSQSDTSNIAMVQPFVETNKRIPAPTLNVPTKCKGAAPIQLDKPEDSSANIIEESFQEQPLLLHGKGNTEDVAVLTNKLEQSFTVTETQGQMLHDLSTSLRDCRQDLVEKKEKMFKLLAELREEAEAAGTWEDTESFTIPPTVTSLPSPLTSRKTNLASHSHKNVEKKKKIKRVTFSISSNLELAFRGDDSVSLSPIEKCVEDDDYRLEPNTLNEYLANMKFQKPKLNDADSNSDTGLSSMPSDESLHEFEAVI